MSKNFSFCKCILQKQGSFYGSFKPSASCSSWRTSGHRVNVIVAGGEQLELFKILSYSVARKDQTCESSHCIGSVREFSMQSYLYCKSKSEQSDNSGEGGDGDNNKDKSNQNSTVSSSDQPYDWKEDNFFTKESAFGSNQNKGSGESERPVFVPEEKQYIPSSDEDGPPTNCCMSGCVNCVWIDYVENLTKKYSDPELTREQVLKALNDIDDPNVKTFIMMELKSKKLL